LATDDILEKYNKELKLAPTTMVAPPQNNRPPTGALVESKK
jgi:hypothetical protein